jgi:undecaprenyl-diphosphatase
MTISGGFIAGLKREEAIRFSFLLAFPILLGSGLKKLIDLINEGLFNTIGLEIIVGSIASFVVGLLAIHFLIRFLKNHTMVVFVWYRIFLAVLILIFSF